MANFCILVDADAQRRKQFAGHMADRLALLPGLLKGCLTAGDLLTCWAASPHAPLSQWTSQPDASEKSSTNLQEKPGGAGVVWGLAIGDQQADPINAQQLYQAWAGRSEPAAFDGYYAGMTWDPGDGLRVGADVLGLFPVYYYATDTFVLVGSSAHLFTLHPCFTARFDPAAAAAVLLTQALQSGRCLLQGVRRLAPGRVLHWRAGKGAAERIQHVMQADPRPASLPLIDQMHLLDEVLGQAVARQARWTDSTALLLSGGLDSRTIASVLARQGRESIALTKGQPADLEVRCAAAVARELGWQHQLTEVPDHGAAERLELMAFWEQLGGGCQCLSGWGLAALTQPVAKAVWSGCVLDNLLPFRSLLTAYDPDARQLSFDRLWESDNEYGLSPQRLGCLLSPSGGRELVDSVIRQAREDYHASAELDHQRVLLYDCFNDGRFHVGADFWRMSFGAWPLVPVLDRQLISLCLGLPAASVWHRTIQNQLLIRKHRALAELPLDRNELRTCPLLPGRRERLFWHWYDHQPWFRRTMNRIWQRGGERRRYYRVFDFDGPAWREARQAAQPYRDVLAGVLDREELDRLLPPADQPVGAENPFTQTAACKILTCLTRWAGAYPQAVTAG